MISSHPSCGEKNIKSCQHRESNKNTQSGYKIWTGEQLSGHFQWEPHSKAGLWYLKEVVRGLYAKLSEVTDKEETFKRKISWSEICYFYLSFKMANVSLFVKFPSVFYLLSGPWSPGKPLNSACPTTPARSKAIREHWAPYWGCR